MNELPNGHSRATANKTTATRHFMDIVVVWPKYKMTAAQIVQSGGNKVESIGGSTRNEVGASVCFEARCPQCDRTANGESDQYGPAQQKTVSVNRGVSRHFAVRMQNWMPDLQDFSLWVLTHA